MALFSGFFTPPKHEQLMPLAALFQACELVDQLANSGRVDALPFQACLKSLLVQNATTDTEIYGANTDLELGFATLKMLLDASANAQIKPSLTYVIGVLQLERRLMKQAAIREQVAKGIKRTSQQAELFGIDSDALVDNVASLYLDTLSTFNYRIQVKGNPDHLQQQGVASRIRCMLFSGVRNAVLWRQRGGRRHHLLSQRKALLHLID